MFGIFEQPSSPREMDGNINKQEDDADGVKDSDDDSNGNTRYGCQRQCFDECNHQCRAHKPDDGQVRCEDVATSCLGWSQYQVSGYDPEFHHYHKDDLNFSIGLGKSDKQCLEEGGKDKDDRKVIARVAILSIQRPM